MNRWMNKQQVGENCPSKAIWSTKSQKRVAYETIDNVYYR